MDHLLKLVIFLGLILSGDDLSAQVSSLQLGFRLGGGMSVNPGMNKILVSEDYYSNYSFKDKWLAVPTVEVFAQYHAPESIIGVEGGISYWQKASKLVYDDKEGLHYKVTPRYNYLGLTALLKVYPWRKGFNVAVGGRAGANLNDKGISYDSNQEEERFSKYQFATVAETERLMKEKLTGRADVAIGSGLGYEIGGRWGIDLRYFYGVTSTSRQKLTISTGWRNLSTATVSS